jgi:hypothetical protein
LLKLVEPRAFRVPDCCRGCGAVLDIVCQAGVVRRRVTALTRVHRIPTDYRDGFATFMLVDTRRDWSFCVCSQGSRDFALYDCLRSTYRSRASTRIIDTLVAATHFVGSSHHHEILIDGRNGSLDWWTDDQIACRVQGVDIPSRLNIALGVATLGSVERTVAQTYCPESGLSVSFGPVSIQGPS